MMIENIKAKLKELRDLVFSNKSRIDALENKSETDPTVPSHVKAITQADIEKWNTIDDISDTVFANGADYAEIGIWNDLNPNKEDRLHRFVTLVGSGRKITIANSTSQIVGVTSSNAAFVGNAKDYDSSDKTKAIVGIVGVVNVKTNDSTIVAGDRVMSDDNGYAIKSSNNCGYRVLSIDDGLLEIVISPNTDMIQRIKEDMVEVEHSIPSPYDDTIVFERIVGLENTKASLVDIDEAISEYDENLTENVKYLMGKIDDKFTQQSQQIVEQGKTLENHESRIDALEKGSEEVITDVIDLSQCESHSGYVSSSTGDIREHNDWKWYLVKAKQGDIIKVSQSRTQSGIGVVASSIDTKVDGMTKAGRLDSINYEGVGVELIAPNETKSFIVNEYIRNGTTNITKVELTHTVRKEEQIDDTNPLARINERPKFISMFKRICCIGDSLTRGAMQVDASTESEDYGTYWSYPNQMHLMTGIQTINFGISGATVSKEYSWNWIEVALGNRSHVDSDELTTTKIGDAYIIALGTNDIAKFGSFTGTIGVDDENVNTSLGAYNELIAYVKLWNQHCKIFLVTIPNSRNAKATRQEANAKIKYLAEKNGCYVIDLETYAEQENDEYSAIFKNGSHENTLGYNLRARQYITYIDWIIKNNFQDFKQIFIGNYGQYLDDSQFEYITQSDIQWLGEFLNNFIYDVQINGASITQDGVANIPKAGKNNEYGVTFASGSYGTQIVNNTGEIRTLKANKSYIDSREHDYNTIVPSNLDYAVKVAMTDGKGADWTSEEQLAGRKRLGLEKEWVLKGVLNTDNKDVGVNVDFSGCTEFYLIGTCETIGSCAIGTNISLIAGSVITSSTKRLYLRYEDMDFGLDGVVGKSNSSLTGNRFTSVLTQIYTHIDVYTKDITNIYLTLPDNVTTCEFEIYAR